MPKERLFLQMLKKEMKDVRTAAGILCAGEAAEEI